MSPERDFQSELGQQYNDAGRGGRVWLARGLLVGLHPAA